MKNCNPTCLCIKCVKSCMKACKNCSSEMKMRVSKCKEYVCEGTQATLSDFLKGSEDLCMKKTKTPQRGK